MRRRSRNSTNSLWFVVAAAVPLGLLVISGCRDASGKHAVVIDESRGIYKDVGLGSSAGDVQKGFGEGVSAGGFAPLGRLPSEVGVPPFLPSPPGAGRQRPQLRRYLNVAFLLAGGRVYAMMLTDSGLRTRRGIAIGSRLAEVRSSYVGVKCSQAPGGETLTGRVATYPVCRIRLRRDRSLWFGDDPIRSFTFLSREPVDQLVVLPRAAAVGLKRTAPAALALCRRLSLVRSVCPRQVPSTRAAAARPPGFRGAAAAGAIAVCADRDLRGVPITSGACRYQSWSLEAGAPAGLPTDAPPGIRSGRPRLGRTRPPRYLHILIYAARGTVAKRLFPFAWPLRPAVPLRNSLLDQKRTVPVSLGRVRWRGHEGQLVLAPPLVFGGELGDHLIFHWRARGVERVVSLHAWAPLVEAVATLKAVVGSAAVPLVSWPAAQRLVRSCKVTAVEQTHRKTVTLTLRTGQEVWTHEPAIDDVVHDVVQVGVRCPPIILATE